MAIVRWDPFRDLASLQNQVNRVFSDVYGRAGEADEGLFTSGTWQPPVDIFQNGRHELVLKAELPEMKREDIEITVENDTVAIRGEKKFSSDIAEDQYHRIERRYGTFTRTFTLPPTVDAGKVTADYKDGVLTVTLPLKEEAKPRQIKVEIAG
jgi:HSP20 family protein